MAQLKYQTVKDTHQTSDVISHVETQPESNVFLQDLMALSTILAPLIICIGFFFTLKAKTLELEKSIASLGSNFSSSMSNAHEMLLLKIDAKLIVFSERMDVLRIDTRENAEEIKTLHKEIKLIRHQKDDILNQLSKLGIDLYVIGDNDRRQHNRLE